MPGRALGRVDSPGHYQRFPRFPSHPKRSGGPTRDTSHRHAWANRKWPRYDVRMTLGLRRHQHEGHDHFITVSCHNRKPFLASDEAKQTFLHHLERVRERHGLQVFGYVLMPEHVHLLVNEPEHTDLEKTMRVLKVQVSKQLKGDGKRFWLRATTTSTSSLGTSASKS